MKRIIEKDLYRIIKETAQSVLKEAKELISPDEAERLGFAIDNKDTAYQDGEFVEPKNLCLM